MKETAVIEVYIKPKGDKYYSKETLILFGRYNGTLIDILSEMKTTDLAECWISRQSYHQIGLMKDPQYGTEEYHRPAYIGIAIGVYDKSTREGICRFCRLTDKPENGPVQ